jgi:K+-transporting ATPase ATPase A chain
VRGFARKRAGEVGNVWVDLVRATLWVLLPASLLGGLLLVWQGVPMNANPYVQASGVEGSAQTIAQGPVAALEIIKNLGTNGGGFFDVNAAHPYANPTPVTNLLAALAITVLPAAFTNTFGRMIGRPRQGWVLYWVMVFLFAAGLVAHAWAEGAGNPQVARLTGPSSATAPSAAVTLPGAPWRARRCASVSPARPWRPSPPRTAPPAPTTPCTTASRPWGAWCPW